MNTAQHEHSFGRRCVAEILRAKKAAKDEGRELMSSQVAEIIDKLYEARPKAPRKKTPLNAMTEEAFMEMLASEHHLKAVDINLELARYQFWCKTNNKQPTRRRFVNWINKTDVTLRSAGGTLSLPSRAKVETPEPPGWQQWVRENATDPSHADKPWEQLSPEGRKYIASQINKQ